MITSAAKLIAKDRQLTLPGFKASPVGLVANKKLTQEQWEEAGYLLGHFERRIMWFIGDWINAGETSGYVVRGKHQEACERFGIAYGTARNAACVGNSLELSRRRDKLSFGHHTEVANRADADELLDWCEDNDASIKDLREEKKKRAKAERLALTQEQSLGGKYGVIYADPPWQYTSGDQHTDETQETVLGTHYPSMPLDEICELQVEDMATDNCVLFLWVTSPLLEESFTVIEAWGFEYKTSIVWDKVAHNVGNYVSVRHEFLLVCTRGTCTPQNVKLFDSVQSIDRKKHSEKPEEFRKIIETLYPKGKKLELFARKKTKGWKAWGNESND